MKHCVRCRQDQPLTEFHQRRGAKDGKQGMCKKCAAARTKKWSTENPAYKSAYNKKNRSLIRDIARRYQWRVSGLPAPTRARPATCECCGLPPSKRALALDHDHTSGHFRGWLCMRCNTAIGMLGDTIDGVAGAIEYLLKSAPKELTK